jgi:hypothetical protein
MALTTAFLNTCRDAIADLAELTAFRSALAGALSGTRSARVSAWSATYAHTSSDPSPAYNLRRAIRDTVNAQADASGALGLLDRESAYQTLSAEFAPDYPKPPSDAEEAAALEIILSQEQLS